MYYTWTSQQVRIRNNLQKPLINAVLILVYMFNKRSRLVTEILPSLATKEHGTWLSIFSRLKL